MADNKVDEILSGLSEDEITILDAVIDEIDEYGMSFETPEDKLSFALEASAIFVDGLEEKDAEETKETAEETAEEAKEEDEEISATDTAELILEAYNAGFEARIEEEKKNEKE